MDWSNIDYQGIMSSPLFQAGIQGLLAPTNAARGPALLQGLQAGTQLQAAQQQQKLNALKIQQAQNAANFNPQDYMQTAPTPVGTNAALGTASQALPAQMPSILGGPIGSQTAQPGANPASLPVEPTPGTPTGRVDMPGLLTGAMQAGLGPQDAQAIGSVLDPETAARVALASKFEKLAPGEVGINGMGQPIAQNGNAPVNDPAAIIARTQAAQAARAAGNTALADQLDASVQKQSGVFDQQMRQATMANTEAQRAVTNQNHQETIDLRKANQELVQNQREQNNQFQTQRQAVQFTNQLEKASVPQAQAVLDNINTIMSKYPKGQLPGYGVVDGLKPMWALSADGQQLRQAVAQLANINLKVRSGAAVTQQEYDRFRQELGNSSFVPEDRIRQGITQMQNLVEAEKKHFVAGTPRNVIQSYEENGGMPLSYLLPPEQKAAAPATGVTIESATPADIKAAIARKMGKK